MFYHLPCPIWQPFATYVKLSVLNVANATEEFNFKFYLILSN